MKKLIGLMLLAWCGVAAGVIPELVSTPAKISPNALSLIVSAIGAK